MTEMFNAYLICSIKMTVVAVTFLIISPFLSRQYGFKWQYYAWLIIIIGYIIPIRPNLAPSIETNTVSRLMLSDMPQSLEYLYKSTVEAISTADTSDVSISSGVTSGQIITVIWLIGVICIIASQIFKHYRFMKVLKRWSHEIGNYGRLRVIGCPIIGSPMMTGIIRPAILLPDTNYTEDELGFIIKHELMHYKRKDLWYKYALVIAKVLHWFNPMIYVVSHKAAVLCELSCDEAMIKNADTHEKKRYSQAILSSAMFQAGIKTEFIANFTGGKKLMNNRIQAIMNGKEKKANLIIILFACLLTLNAGVGLVNLHFTDITETSLLEWDLLLSNISIKPGVPLITPSTKAEIAYYAKFDITYDPYKNGLCYNGDLVGLFIDRCRRGQGIIFLNQNGEVNIKIGRDNKGKLTEVKTLGDDVDYEIDIYRQELEAYWAETGFYEWNLPGNNVSQYSGVPIITPSTQMERNYYAEFGIVYDRDKHGYCYNGNLVGLFIDKCRNGQGVIFLSENGEVNIKIKREMISGKLIDVETLSNDVDHEIEVFFHEQSIETAFKMMYLD